MQQPGFLASEIPADSHIMPSLAFGQASALTVIREVLARKVKEDNLADYRRNIASYCYVLYSEWEVAGPTSIPILILPVTSIHSLNPQASNVSTARGMLLPMSYCLPPSDQLALSLQTSTKKVIKKLKYKPLNHEIYNLAQIFPS